MDQNEKNIYQNETKSDMESTEWGWGTQSQTYDSRMRNRNERSKNKGKKTEKSENFKILKFQRLLQSTQIRTRCFRTNFKKQWRQKAERSRNRMSRQIHRITKAPTLTQQEEHNEDNERKKFNYPIEISAIHRDGRCLKTSKIWVQGLPMDITQVIGIIDILKEVYKLDVTDQSKEDICSRIAAIALNTSKERGTKVIDVIGSTNAVAAFVFELSIYSQQYPMQRDI